MQEEIFQAGTEQDGKRLDLCLTDFFPDFSRAFLQKLIKEEQVLVDGTLQNKPSFLVSEGESISVTVPEASDVELVAEDIPLDILYEDDDILVVNKPKGMVVHPAIGHPNGTLVNAVMFHCKDSLSGIGGELRPGIVHRIDKDTTGSLMICKNDQSHISIAAQLKAHSVKRIYKGIVCGNLKDDEGTVTGAIGRSTTKRLQMAVNEKDGKPAVTHYKVLERFGAYTYAQFQLETGRTHQIRVHMAHIGHPLLGDPLYGGRCPFPELVGQTLHAQTIGFVHPRTGEYMEFDAPLPEYFEALLKKLKSMM